MSHKIGQLPQDKLSLPRVSTICWRALLFTNLIYSRGKRILGSLCYERVFLRVLPGFPLNIYTAFPDWQKYITKITKKNSVRVSEPRLVTGLNPQCTVWHIRSLLSRNMSIVFSPELVFHIEIEWGTTSNLLINPLPENQHQT